MPVSGLGVVANQIISGGEKLLALPKEGEAVIAPNRVHKIEIDWVEDTKGHGVRVIKVLADLEEHYAQVSGGHLALVPPSNKPCSEKSHAESAGRTEEVGPTHEPVWWVFPLGALTGIGLPIMLYGFWEWWKLRKLLADV